MTAITQAMEANVKSMIEGFKETSKIGSREKYKCELLRKGLTVEEVREKLSIYDSL